MTETVEACTHEMVECPNHEGNFDCNPFCRKCEGYQEYCPKGCEFDVCSICEERFDVVVMTEIGFGTGVFQCEDCWTNYGEEVK